MIVVVAFSVGIAYSVYHYRERIFPSVFLADDRKTELRKSTKGTSSSRNHDIEEKLHNPKLTAVSSDFFKQMDLLELDSTEKDEFLKEMLALNPFERNLIIRDMNNHNVG